MGRVYSKELECKIKMLSNSLEREEYLSCLKSISKYINIEEPLLPQARQLNVKGLSLRYFLIILYKNFNINEKLEDQLTKLEDLELNAYLGKKKQIDK